MPIYEYQCKKCTKKFEDLEPVNLNTIRKCVMCGGDANRVISAVHFTFSSISNGKWIGDSAKELKKLKKKR